jgi:hypothetical protein
VPAPHFEAGPQVPCRKENASTHSLTVAPQLTAVNVFLKAVEARP